MQLVYSLADGRAFCTFSLVTFPHLPRVTAYSGTTSSLLVTAPQELQVFSASAEQTGLCFAFLFRSVGSSVRIREMMMWEFLS